MNTKDNNGNKNSFSNQGKEESNSKSSYQGGSTQSSAPDTNAGTGDSKQAKINLPTGGGAIRGIGEKFEANPVTGTASFSVPLTISEGRGGFTPQLALSYDSGSGNSVFGLGWSVGLPSITRKTDKGLPQYNDNPDNESDTFILSGAEDMVPILDANGKQKNYTISVDNATYKVYSYRPRIEGLFAVIERWVNQDTKISHWRSISKENITSVFGCTEQARIFDLQNERKIFSWLLEESWDAKGNLMQFTYKQENSLNVEDTCYEAHRLKKSASVINFPNRYLKKVSYGNKTMCTPSLLASGYNGEFYFDLVFDYTSPPALSKREGAAHNVIARNEAISKMPLPTSSNGEEQDKAPSLRGGATKQSLMNEQTDSTAALGMTSKNPDCFVPRNDASLLVQQNLESEILNIESGINDNWPARQDAFSNYKAGFEIRTYRLCHRVLMYHSIESNTPVLVKSTELEYDTTKAFTLLKKVVHCGHDGNEKAQMPALEFSYSEAVVGTKLEQVDESQLRNLPAGVDGQNYQWADLYSEGISGILKQDNNAWYFMPNYTSPPALSKGEGADTNVFARNEAISTSPVRFGGMHSEIPKPAAIRGRNTGFRLDDVDSDGLPELVIEAKGQNGFYSRDEDGKWLNFRNFKEFPNLDFNDGNLRYMDLSGDGLSDIVISRGEYFDIYFSEGKKGYGNYRRVRCSNESGAAPVIVFSDPMKRIFLADMSGDGLTDIVRITHSSICYWPNMGYGRFGEKVVMSNPPLLDSLDSFDARFIHLADVDGTGTTDLIYISKHKIRYFKNLSGNTWEEEILSDTLSCNANQQTFIQTTDLLGNGTQCLVFSSSLPQKSKQMRYWELATSPPAPSKGGGAMPYVIARNEAISKIPLPASPNGEEQATAEVKEQSSTSNRHSERSDSGVVESPAKVQGDFTASPEGGECGGKPFLLNQIVNNMGGVTRLHYASSTKFYMQDKLGGTPWITRLPFAVHVLEKTEIIDLVANTYFTTRYAYHHGFYDHSEREFRGFGMVEQWDTEASPNLTSLPALSKGEGAALNRHSERSDSGVVESPTSAVIARNEAIQNFKSEIRNLESDYVPPVYTKTWFHTGFYKNRGRISRQFEDEYFTPNPQMRALTHTDSISADTKSPLGDSGANAEWKLPDTVFPNGLTGQEAREACRALKGSPLRIEIYALDGSDKEAIPYTVEEKSYHLQCLQHKGENRHGVFLKTDGETLAYHYERDIVAPRIIHSLILETDAYGNPTKQAQVAYPKRDADSNTPDEQKMMLVTYTETDFISTSPPAPSEGGGADPTVIVRNEAIQNFKSEILNLEINLIGIPYQSQQYQIHNLTPPQNAKWEADILLNTIENATPIDYAATIPASGIQKRSIAHTRNYFWDEELDAILPLGEIAAHGLPHHSENLVFTPVLLQKILDENQNDNTVLATKDISVLTQLLLNEGKFYDTENDGYLWQETGKMTYNASQFYLPVSEFDAMGNETTITYDSYNLLIAEIQDAQNNTIRSWNDYRLLQPYMLQDPNENYTSIQFDILGFVTAQAIMGKQDPQNPTVFEGDTLDDPTIVYVYDLFNWQENKKANYVRTFMREKHGQENATNWANVDLEAYGENAGWIESIVYSDGMGNELLSKMQAVPGMALTTTGNPETLVKQSSGNNVRWLTGNRVVLNNKGKPAKEYEPYFTLSHEFENYPFLDTNHEFIQAIYFMYDPLLRVIRTDFPDDTLTKVEFDIWQQKNFDQNDNDANSPHYDTPQVINMDVLGRAFQTNDDLGGTSKNYCITHNTLDITSNIIQVKDALLRNATMHYYNLLNEPVFISNIDSGKRWILNNAASQNMRLWDNLNREIRTLYDTLVRPTDTVLVETSTIKLVTQIEYGISSVNNSILQPIVIKDQSGETRFTEYDFKGNNTEQEKCFCKNYQTTVNWNDANSCILEAETFTQEISFDALNRPILLTQPDNSEQAFEYNQSALLTKVKNKLTPNAQWEDYVTEIKYNEKGQREHIYYGNNTKTRYDYNLLNFRLTRLLTTRNNGTDILQDINYSYDAVGNIIQQKDDAQQTFYFNNSVIAPTGNYEYDALYRLIKAEGRELTSLTAPSHNDFPDNIPCPNPAANAMQNYVHNYQYDKLGNILQDAWKSYQYATANNYLLGNDNIANQYTYDAHGNMLNMPHLSHMSWNYNNELVNTTNGTFTSYYNYNWQGDRTRKVIDNGSIKETRYYFNGYELYRKTNTNNLETECHSLNILDLKQISEEQEESNIIASFYDVFDGNKRIALIENMTISQGQSSNLITKRYQYGNHLGSSCLELNESGAIISYEEYHPFGTTSYRNGESYSEVSLKRYKYIGKELDSETGFYYYGMRYYAAWLCRFVSVDPLQFEYSYYTPYQYAGNKPTIFIDLDGAEEDNFQNNPINDEINSYYMNNRGFWIQNDENFGDYVGNVKPETGRYMELERINGTLYHKNTENTFASFGNFINSLLGGEDNYFVEKKSYSVEEETRNDFAKIGAEFAITGMVFKAIGGLAGQLLKNAGNSIWKVAPLQRGFVYEKILGGNLVRNYPVIDKFTKGVATSIKTMDITAKTYLKGNNVYNVLKGYIDKLAKFTGENMGGVNTTGGAIKSKVLEVGIPKGATKTQVQQINRAIKYAQKNGIKMNVRAVK